MSRLLCIIEIYCMFCIICIIHNTIEHLSGCWERLPMVCVRADFVLRKNSVWGLCIHRNFDFFSMLNVTLSRLLMSAACGVLPLCVDRQAVRMSARIGGDVLLSGCGGCPTSALMSGRCVGLYPPIVSARWDDKSGLFTEIFFWIYRPLVAMSAA